MRVRNNLADRDEALAGDARRLSNGTIDYDFYRARARSLRREARAAHGRFLLDGARGLMAAAMEWARDARSSRYRTLASGQPV